MSPSEPTNAATRFWRYFNEPYTTTKLVVALFLISFACGLISFIWRLA